MFLVPLEMRLGIILQPIKIIVSIVFTLKIILRNHCIIFFILLLLDIFCSILLKIKLNSEKLSTFIELNILVISEVKQYLQKIKPNS